MHGADDGPLALDLVEAAQQELSEGAGMLDLSEDRFNDLLAQAIAAAVVGGTSLAGGRGRVVDAVLGGFALTILAYGMSDLIKGGNAAAYQFIITGIVLLLAAAVDALSRHAGRVTS